MKIKLDHNAGQSMYQNLMMFWVIYKHIRVKHIKLLNSDILHYFMINQHIFVKD